MKNSSSTNSTILVIVLGLLVLSFIFKTDRLVIAATIIGIVALLIPVLGEWIEFIWFKIAHVLGWINTRLLLGIVFFIVLLPIAILFRLSNKNPLKIKRVEDSLFVTRNHQYVKSDLKDMW